MDIHSFVVPPVSNDSEDTQSQRFGVGLLHHRPQLDVEPADRVSAGENSELQSDAASAVSDTSPRADAGETTKSLSQLPSRAEGSASDNVAGFLAGSQCQTVSPRAISLREAVDVTTCMETFLRNRHKSGFKMQPSIHDCIAVCLKRHPVIRVDDGRIDAALKTLWYRDKVEGNSTTYAQHMFRKNANLIANLGDGAKHGIDGKYYFARDAQRLVLPKPQPAGCDTHCACGSRISIGERDAGQCDSCGAEYSPASKDPATPGEASDWLSALRQVIAGQESQLSRLVGAALAKQHQDQEVDVCDGANDGNVDVAVKRSDPAAEPGDEKASSIWQVKCQSQPVGISEIRQLNGTDRYVDVETEKMIVSASGFSDDALDEAARIGITCVDGEALYELLGRASIKSAQDVNVFCETAPAHKDRVGSCK